MWRPPVFQILFMVMAFAVGCSDDDSIHVKVKVEKHGPISEIPFGFIVPQRTTNEVPNSNGVLLLTVGDITGGQVMVSMATKRGTVVLPTRSMRIDDSVNFKFEDTEYALDLQLFQNSWFSQDRVTFWFSNTSSDGSDEQERIERLISAVENLNDAKFIRNGSEYSAAEAADHLRSKLEAAGNEILTAEHFIEHIGSKSSTSGEPYQIKFSNGTVVNAGDFLRLKLNETK
jgi:hypothetical protein